ncbi:hypothetical protein E2562_019825 [Oryza meyeriana var. granulata]|uniref:Knottins-like domain-containing protein n=1 Tax=Oryza meyeriana var. granulata TaxID=110450 RepID=A0A6G1DMW4_9ORYZ|nr:hypothetical protein E2562_019825 [Oryza meyeriana var. granulata]
MGGSVVQAKLCEKPSKDFKGVCLSSQNCGNKCEKEGYIDGKCKHLIPRCYCAMECGSTVA